MGVRRRIFWVLIPFIGILFILGNGKTAEARKYYSLQNIGLSGCTTDNVDYTIVSIRGNTIKYIKYQFSEKKQEWRRLSGIQTAKLTSSTKYYMANPEKVSASLKKKSGANSKTTSTKKVNSKRSYLAKKNINTEKWIYRVRKGTIKKKVYGHNNEIRVVKGKVTKLAVGLTY